MNLNLRKSNSVFGLGYTFLFMGTAHWFVPFSKSFSKQ